MYNPTLALESHFGMDLPGANLLFKAYTGQPQVWFALRFGATYTPENLSDGQVTSLLSANEFLIFCVFLKA
jgi:hypothetical protein